MVDFGLATRVCYVETAGKSELFMEPVITTRFGFKFIKVSMQLGYSSPYNDVDSDIDYQPFIFSMGLQARIGRKYD